MPLSQIDRLVGVLAKGRRHLIGLSLLRILLGVASIMFYVSDYSRREFLWGPNSYDSQSLAARQMGGGLFSLYSLSNSQTWFELVFHAGLLTAILFTIFGGRALTILQAVFIWSIYNRNQDILEGGDNLARILIIFMIFAVTNAYLAPGARRRRERLTARAGTLPIAVHNLSVYLIVFQICVLYFVAGYSKITGTVWQDGVALYYISRNPAFSSSGLWSSLMSQPFLGTAVAYITIIIEIAFPFAVLSRRAIIRKAEILFIEGMHFGIIAFMGLVCFGTIMLAADFAVLRDEDFLTMRRAALTMFAAAQSRTRQAQAAEPLVVERVP